MEIGGWIAIGIVVVLLFYVTSIYNKLVRNKQLVYEDWSRVDAQLKKRANLVPNLVDAVKEYIKKDNDLIEELIKMRAKVQRVSGGDPEKRGNAEILLYMAMYNIHIAADNYPELKESKSYQQIRESFYDIQDEMQLIIRDYNTIVRDSNALIRSFPGKIIAKKLHFTTSKYFGLLNDEENVVTEVDFTDSSNDSSLAA